MSFNRYDPAFLKQLWMINAMTLICVLGAAFLFQHVIGLQPCVMCIYERLIFIVMLILAVACSTTMPGGIVHLIAALAYLITAMAGMKLSIHHLMLQRYPTPFDSCPLFVDFPSWLPLDKILPSFFLATGECSIDQWDFLGVSMVTWVLVIFFLFFLFGLWAIWHQSRLKKKANVGT